MRFVDTNILLYAVSTEPSEQVKTETARDLLAERDLALSVQVLGEFYVQATRSTQPDPLSHAQAAGLVESFLRYPVQPNDVSVAKAALATFGRFQISYWDASIIEAARALGCEIVLSEDLNPGQDYGGIRVVDPFTGPGPAED